MKNPLSDRPWLLVIAAFLILIAVWFTVITLSGRIDTHRLTPVEETHLLKGEP